MLTHHSIFLCTHYPIYNLHTCIHTTAICIHTHIHTHPCVYTLICIHTTSLRIHTICIHMHTPNRHMHTHPYAYTSICIHIIPYAHTSLLNLQSHQQLYIVPCVLQHVGNYCYSMTPFSLFLYLGLNKENVCPVCVCVHVCVLSLHKIRV